MIFSLIDAWKAVLPIRRMCSLLKVSSSGYYSWKNRLPSKRQLDDKMYLAIIRQVFFYSNKTYGYLQIHAELIDKGFVIGKHRVARLMRENGLKVLYKKRFKRTTDSHHHFPIAPNLLDQDFACSGPNQKWGADISYIWTSEGWLYLAIILGLFSRKIVGWDTSDRLKKELAINALNRAIAIRQPLPSLI